MSADAKPHRKHDALAVTLEEAKYALGENPPKTRLRSGRAGPSAPIPKPAPKPKLAKTKTMAATTAEAKAIIGDGGDLGHTRSGDKEAEEVATDDEATEKKPKLAKTKTMAATTAEAKDITGSKKRGKTRQATEEAPKIKKTKTMAQTVAEAKAILGE